MFGSMEFRNKFISIGYCMLVVVIYSFSVVYAQKDYCSMNYKYCPKNTTHISCTNNGVNIDL